MKPFKGPKHQGGWIGIAAAVVGGIASSAASQKAAKNQNKMNYADSRDLSELQFQQQQWLAEQSRKWNLEDYQRQQNYKEDAIAGFRNAAPPNTASKTGQWGPPPARTAVDTSGLAPRQSNGQPVIIDPRTGQMMNAGAAPLSQFG